MCLNEKGNSKVVKKFSMQKMCTEYWKVSGAGRKAM